MYGGVLVGVNEGREFITRLPGKDMAQCHGTMPYAQQSY